MKNIIWMLLFLSLSCKQTSENVSLSSNSETTSQSTAISDRVHLNVNLVDSPRDDIQNVYVNIRHIELKIKKSSRSKEIKIGEDTGVIDLLTLREGMSLSMGDVVLPAYSEITQIRLVLESEGNELFFKDNTSCELQTPSQQQSGLKILMKNSILESGYEYTLVVDFDALESVVFTGQGDCILKPVLKVKSLDRIVKIEAGSGGSGSSSTEDSKEDVIENFDDNFFDPTRP
jgi:hypothetical protein